MTTLPPPSLMAKVTRPNRAMRLAMETSKEHGTTLHVAAEPQPKKARTRDELQSRYNELAPQAADLSYRLYALQRDANAQAQELSQKLQAVHDEMFKVNQAAGKLPPPALAAVPDPKPEVA